MLDIAHATLRDANYRPSSKPQAGRDGAAAEADGDGMSDGYGGAGNDGNSDGRTAGRTESGATPPPSYPLEARRRGEQGTVTLRVLVGANGAVVRAEVARSSGFQLLDHAALETVRRQWRFVAARRDGKAVRSWVIVPIRFALTEASAAQ